MSTSGCGRPSATGSAWSWRPALGAGTKVSMRVPKFHPGVRADASSWQLRDRGFLRVLAVDDEPPALDELAYLLRADPRVARLHTAGDATEALRVLRDGDVDAVFLDIRMPGLDGMELARVLRRFARPPAIVFVTAYDDGAADAFDLGAADYVRKPVQAERLAESLRRVLGVPAGARPSGRAPGTASARTDPTIPVELAGTHPDAAPLGGALGRGAGRLRPAAHRGRLAPGPGVAGHARRALGGRRVRPHPPVVPGAAAS